MCDCSSRSYLSIELLIAYVCIQYVCESIDCTRKWIGNAAYIVYVTSLVIIRTVTAGVTNDKDSVLL